ncbi:MAG TPA: hypothetical protein VF988_04585 [Verrucomicrobiae bacterium]
MNTLENKTNPLLLPKDYWRLWLVNAVLVSAGMLFGLATQYGTFEFFGTACLMALLPFIPIMVLVGGAGSTIFALTKVFIEKRSLKRTTALGLLLGPGLVVTLLLVLAGANRSPGHWLNYICIGHAPAATGHVRVAGYSTFLREEWLAVFAGGQKDFETMADGAKMAPADSFEFKKWIEQSSLKDTSLYQGLPPLTNAIYYRRIFNAKEEHERGSVYAVFAPGAATVVVARQYRD